MGSAAGWRGPSERVSEPSVTGGGREVRFQAMIRARLGFAPVLTASVFLATAVPSVLGLVVPAVEVALRRDRTAIDHGEVWRLVTALVVQDGGVAGTVFNLVGLAVMGLLAERLVSRRDWVIAYLTGALVGELAGWAGWQPVGAGNSIGVCGLSGMLAIALARSRRVERPAVAGAAVTILWSVLVAVTSWTSATAVIIPVVAVVWSVLNVGVRVRPGQLGTLAAAVVALAALALLARADIHGSALAAGLALGILLAHRGRVPPIEAPTN